MLSSEAKCLLDEVCDTLTELTDIYVYRDGDPEVWIMQFIGVVSKLVHLSDHDVGFNVYRGNPISSSVRLLRSYRNGGSVVWVQSESFKGCYSDMVDVKEKGGDLKICWVEFPYEVIHITDAVRCESSADYVDQLVDRVVTGNPAYESDGYPDDIQLLRRLFLEFGGHKKKCPMHPEYPIQLHTPTCVCGFSSAEEYLLRQLADKEREDYDLVFDRGEPPQLKPKE